MTRVLSWRVSRFACKVMKVVKAAGRHEEYKFYSSQLLEDFFVVAEWTCCFWLWKREGSGIFEKSILPRNLELLMRICRKILQRSLHSQLPRCISLYRLARSWLATCSHSWTLPWISSLSGFLSRGRLTCFCSPRAPSPCPWSAAAARADSACTHQFFAPACSGRTRYRRPLASHFWSVASSPPRPSSSCPPLRSSSAPQRRLATRFAPRRACFAWSLERDASGAY